MEIVILSFLTILASILMFVIAYTAFQANAVLLTITFAAVGMMSLVTVFTDMWE